MDLPKCKLINGYGFDRQEMLNYLEIHHQNEERVIRRLQNQVTALQEGKRALGDQIEEMQKRQLTQQRQTDELLRKAGQYDDIQFHLFQIHQKAEADAFMIRETAKEHAMDAVAVIDEIQETVSLFEQDIEILKTDLTIGTMTVEDRITQFLYITQNYLQTLEKIRKQFFEENHLPIEKSNPQK